MRTSSCRTKRRGRKGTIRSPLRGEMGRATRYSFLQADQREVSKTHRNHLLVGGTRGGWRDGKSEVRVSGSWNRQGAKARLEARHWAPRGHWLPRFVALFRSPSRCKNKGKLVGTRLSGASCHSQSVLLVVLLFDGIGKTSVSRFFLTFARVTNPLVYPSVTKIVLGENLRFFWREGTFEVRDVFYFFRWVFLFWRRRRFL